MHRYFRMAQRRWKLALVCVLGCLAIAALMTVKSTPTYSSTARLFVSSPQRDSTQAYEGTLFTAQRVTSYADLVDSQQVTSGVIDRLDLRSTPSELAARVSATVVPDTVVVQVTGTGASPLEAQRLTQAVAEQWASVVSDVDRAPGSRPPIDATIVDPASLPAAPVSPQPLRTFAIAVVFGLLLGLGVAVLRELLDPTIKDPEDVAEVANVPVVGNVALDPQAPQQPLIIGAEPDAPRVEAFRVLGTNLRYVHGETDPRVVTVTSCTSEEGRTTTAANLAITLAEGGHTVLLLEGDLRRPHIAKLLGLEEAGGLSTALLGQRSLEDLVRESGVPNLSVLTSGPLPQKPAELLQSKVIAAVLSEARRTYEVVVIDAPPLLPVTDTALLAARSDGVLIVIEYGKTRRDELRQALQRLEAVGARPLGMVLNMIPQVRAPQYGYAYGASAHSGLRARGGIGGWRNRSQGSVTEGRLPQGELD